VEADVDAHLVIKRVPGVRTSGMGAGGTFETAQIIAVAKAIVAAWSTPRSGSSCSGQSASGAPLGQRPTIFAPSSASSSRLAALARLDRPLARIGAGDSAPFHRRLPDSVLEAEGGASGRELVTVLAPDDLDPG
jgi:hypothetical protein